MSYHVLLAVTGDRATAHTQEGILLAARTLVDDARRAMPGLRLNHARDSLTILQDYDEETGNGRYCANLTIAARRGAW